MTNFCQRFKTFIIIILARNRRDGSPWPPRLCVSNARCSIFVLSRCGSFFFFWLQDLPDYAHISADDKQTVQKAAEAALAWMNERIDLQNKSPLNVDPVTKAADFNAKRTALEAQVRRIRQYNVCFTNTSFVWALRAHYSVSQSCRSRSRSRSRSRCQSQRPRPMRRLAPRRRPALRYAPVALCIASSVSQQLYASCSLSRRLPRAARSKFATIFQCHIV